MRRLTEGGAGEVLAEVARSVARAARNALAASRYEVAAASPSCVSARRNNSAPNVCWSPVFSRWAAWRPKANPTSARSATPLPLMLPPPSSSLTTSEVQPSSAPWRQ